MVSSTALIAANQPARNAAVSDFVALTLSAHLTVAAIRWASNERGGKAEGTGESPFLPGKEETRSPRREPGRGSRVLAGFYPDSPDGWCVRGASIIAPRHT